MDKKEDPCEVRFGKWTINVRCDVSTIAPECVGDDLLYALVFEIHGDGDAGEQGMYGELRTNWGWPEGIKHEARKLRLTLMSEHVADGDEDLAMHVQVMDGALAVAMDAAIARTIQAMFLERGLVANQAEVAALQDLERAVRSGKVAVIDAALLQLDTIRGQ